MKEYEKEYIITNDKILLFDLDGTIVNTNFSNFLAYKKAIDLVLKTNTKLSYNSKQRFNRNMLKVYFPNLTEEEFENIVKEKENFYNEYLDKIELIDENVEVLLKYSKSNPTYLVTNCRKDRALKTLNHFGLTYFFTDIFFRVFDDYHIEFNKYENVLSKLNISPDNIIVFENEETEILNAKKAGIKIINPF